MLTTNACQSNHINRWKNEFRHKCIEPLSEAKLLQCLKPCCWLFDAPVSPLQLLKSLHQLNISDHKTFLCICLFFKVDQCLETLKPTFIYTAHLPSVISSMSDLKTWFFKFSGNGNKRSSKSHLSIFYRKPHGESL